MISSGEISDSPKVTDILFYSYIENIFDNFQKVRPLKIRPF